MSYVLIVGAKSDIAKSLARTYAENGYNLYLAARKISEIEKFANDIHIRTLKKVQCVELDILDFASHKAFYKDLDKKEYNMEYIWD